MILPHGSEWEHAGPTLKHVPTWVIALLLQSYEIGEIVNGSDDAEMAEFVVRHLKRDGVVLDMDGLRRSDCDEGNPNLVIIYGWGGIHSTIGHSGSYVSAVEMLDAVASILRRIKKAGAEYIAFHMRIYIEIGGEKRCSRLHLYSKTTNIKIDEQ